MPPGNRWKRPPGLPRGRGCPEAFVRKSGPQVAGTHHSNCEWRNSKQSRVGSTGQFKLLFESQVSKVDANFGVGRSNFRADRLKQFANCPLVLRFCW
jgi:hypothetical protein